MKYALMILTIFITSKTLSPCGAVYTKPKLESVYMTLKQAELDKIKLYEGFRSTPYKDVDGDFCIGYGFKQRYWYKNDTITIQQSDTLLLSIYNKMLSRAIKDFPNNSDSLKIAHLYYWYGNTRGKRIVIRSDNWKNLKRLK